MAVLDRLDELRESSERAARVYRYVDSAHDDQVSTTDLLHVIRAEPELALELRSNTGRRVIAAIETDDGTIRYPVWHHSAVAASCGHDDVQVSSVDRRHEVAETLTDRRPLVRLRSETPLTDLTDYGADQEAIRA